MKRMKMHSQNLTQENIARIRELFPGCITESQSEDGKVKLAVDFDYLRQELSDSVVEGSQERYHLDWPGKRKALLTSNTPISKTLRPCLDESINFNSTNNIFIEGDNLDALKLLQETYLGKIKMIYIDPPYNTGNDYIYKDNFTENLDEFLKKSKQKDEEGNCLTTNTESNGRFHSDWLSMLYPRLRLARNLLRDDGVIFISIDKNEVNNLGKLCDEVFGAQNYIVEFIWNGKSGSEDDGDIRNNHEYLVCYSRSRNNFNAGLDVKENEVFPYYDEERKMSYRRQLLRIWGDNSKREDRPNLYYPIKAPSGDNFYPKLPDGSQGCWRWGETKMGEAVSSGLIKFDTARNGQVEAYEKIYQSDESRQTKKFQSLILDAGSTAGGTKELKLLFDGQKLFDRPKPTAYINLMLKISNTLKDDIILDFFAGSSTTADAVMQLNATDGGMRKFIMVQIPEPCGPKSEAFKAGYKTIAEISRERIRRAGVLISGGADSCRTDIGFRALKVDSTSMNDVFYMPDQIEQNELIKFTDNTKPERSPHDLLFHVLLDWGVDLSLPISTRIIKGKTVFIVDKNALIACFDDGVNEELIKELAQYMPVRAVFRDNGYDSDALKINLTQIFNQISPDTEVKSL